MAAVGARPSGACRTTESRPTGVRPPVPVNDVAIHLSPAANGACATRSGSSGRPCASRRRNTSVTRATFACVRPTASSQAAGARRSLPNRLAGGVSPAVVSVAGSEGVKVTTPGRSPPKSARRRSRGVPEAAAASLVSTDARSAVR